MQSSVRTVYGAYLQTVQLLGLPVVIKPNSTLNEKFEIHESVALAENEMPSVKYVSIGNGGHAMVSGVGNISKPEPIQHTPRDAALFNHLPFILRLPTNDLSVAERENYRLRKTEFHDGILYVAYYLKVLDLSETDPQLELRTVSNGTTVSNEFSPTIGDLNPTPPAVIPNNPLNTTGDYIAATAKVPFEMSADDITEFLNVCDIIYGDVNYAMISEIALCSGYDKLLTGDLNGTAISYTDAIGVQVTNFITAFFSATFTNQALTVNLDLGSAEPLLNIS